LLVIVPDKLVVPAPVIMLAFVPPVKLRIPVLETEPSVSERLEAEEVRVPLLIILAVKRALLMRVEVTVSVSCITAPLKVVVPDCIIVEPVSSVIFTRLFVPLKYKLPLFAIFAPITFFKLFVPLEIILYSISPVLVIPPFKVVSVTPIVASSFDTVIIVGLSVVLLPTVTSLKFNATAPSPSSKPELFLRSIVLSVPPLILTVPFVPPRLSVTI